MSVNPTAHATEFLLRWDRNDANALSALRIALHTGLRAVSFHRLGGERRACRRWSMAGSRGFDCLPIEDAAGVAGLSPQSTTRGRATAPARPSTLAGRRSA